MKQLNLLDIAVYIPPILKKVTDCYELIGINLVEAKIYEKIFKIKQIPIAQESTSYDFFAKVVQELLKNNPQCLVTTELIIYAHTSSITNVFGQSLVRFIQQKFGFKNAICFGITLNKCVSSIASLDLISNYLFKNNKSTAIILSGEICFSSTLRHVPGMSVAGDACCAVLIGEQTDKPRLIAYGTSIDGLYAKGIWLNREERAIYDNKYISFVSSYITNVLSKYNLSLDDIDIIIPHNINEPSWLKVAQRLNVKSKKIFLDNISQIGHILGADVYINLKKSQDLNYIKPNMKSFMFSVGLGASYGYAIWQH